MTVTVSTEEARKNFYPTPLDLAAELLEDIQWHKIQTVLEPSCGKGNLLVAIGKEISEYKREINDPRIDLVEIDPALRGIVTDAFIKRNKNDYYEVYRQYVFQDQSKLTEEDKQKMAEANALYPWNLNQKERDITQTSLRDIFMKYLSIFSDATPKFVECEWEE